MWSFSSTPFSALLAAEPSVRLELLGKIAGHDQTFDAMVVRVRVRIGSSDADDIVQDALLFFCQHLPTFEYQGKGQLFAAFATIIWRQCNTLYGRERTLKRPKAISNIQDNAKCGSPDRAKAPEPNEVVDNVIRMEREDIVPRALDLLETKYREVIVLHDFEGLSFTEIANIKCESENAVRLRYGRAKAELRKILGRKLDEEAR